MAVPAPRTAPRSRWRRAWRWVLVILAVVARPALWATALQQWRRATPHDWMRHRPFLPLPDAAFLRFRLETAYGSTGELAAADFVHYLEWCRDRP